MLDKLDKLKEILKEMRSVVLAFSGGLDSTFLAKVAYDVLGKNVVAVTATSSTYPVRELEEAKKLAELIGIKHRIIESEETDIGEFKKNPVDRCYFCKKELFSKLNKFGDNVIDASNQDDLSDHRPGSKAAKELGVRSPLQEAGIGKKEIREYSKQLDLPTWNKPSFACLASRFPYGEEITKDKLKQVEEAEDFIRSLGVAQLRVRNHNNIARIEVEEKDFDILMENKETVINKLKELGFNYITLDLSGYRTGSMNEVIKPR